MADKTISALLTESIAFLCRYGIKYQDALSVEGSIKVKIDKEEIADINFKRELGLDATNTTVEGLDSCYHGNNQRLSILTSLFEEEPVVQYSICSSSGSNKVTQAISLLKAQTIQDSSTGLNEPNDTVVDEKPKRKRGRPRKKPLETTEGGSEEKPQTVEEKEDNGSKSPEKKRGRKPKVHENLEPSTPIKQEKNEENPIGCSVTRSGRRSIKTFKLKEAFERKSSKSMKTEETTFDKSSGRDTPKKVDDETVEKYDSMLLSDSDEWSPALSEEEAPKKTRKVAGRGRGRPKKHKVSSDDSDEDVSTPRNSRRNKGKVRAGKDYIIVRIGEEELEDDELGPTTIEEIAEDDAAGVIAEWEGVESTDQKDTSTVGGPEVGGPDVGGPEVVGPGEFAMQDSVQPENSTEIPNQVEQEQGVVYTEQIEQVEKQTEQTAEKSEQTDQADGQDESTGADHDYAEVDVKEKDDDNTSEKAATLPDEDSLSKFQCSICRVKLDTAEELKQHKKSHKHACPKCDSVYATAIRLKDHMKVAHEGVRLQCTICNELFKNKDLLYYHIRAHKGLIIPCPIEGCDRSANKKSVLGKHMVYHRSKDRQCPLGCKYEGDDSMDLEVLKNHMATHIEKSDWEKYCVYCETVFETKEVTDEHRPNCPEKPNLPELDAVYGSRAKIRTATGDGFTCEYCSKSFSAKHTLQEHVDNVHKKIVHTCNYCDKSFGNVALFRKHLRWHRLHTCRFKACKQNFNTTEQLREHLKTHDDKEEMVELPSKRGERLLMSGGLTRTKNRRLESDRREKLRLRKLDEHGKEYYECKDCLKKLKSYITYKSHIKYHTGELFYCQECPKFYNRKIRLEEHIERVHQGIRHKCPWCEKTYRSRERVTSHMRLHTGRNLQHCPFEGCNRAFEKKMSLTIHIRTHTGERPYICDICANSYPTSLGLKIHMRRHSKQKRFACPYNDCDMTFYEKSDLKKHCLRHEGKKDHCCAKCGNSYYMKYDLQLHEKTCGLDPQFFPYVCSICEKKYKFANGLERHLVRRHGIKEKVPAVATTTIIPVDAVAEPIDYENVKWEVQEGGEGEETIVFQTDAVDGGEVKEESLYVCTICNSGFVLHEEYNQHMLSHLGNLAEEEGVKIVFLSS